MKNQVVVYLSSYSDEAADGLYDKHGRSQLLVSPEGMEPPVKF